ncbi:MAG: ATP-binding protein [Planctomycetota bacterium]|jgi:serine/threonine-protein kinase RsbW
MADHPQEPGAGTTPLTLTVTRELSQLARVRRALTRLTIDGGFSATDSGMIVMAVDEACANAIRHGDGAHPLEIEVCLDAIAVTIELRDDGGPYPFEELGNDQAAMDRDEVGGMGVYILKQLMDEASYHYDPDRGSRLVLRKNRPVPGAVTE